VEVIQKTAIKVRLPGCQQRKDYTCGAAAVLSVCSYYGIGPRREATIERDMKMNRSGSDPAHLIRALDRYGLAHKAYQPMTDVELRTSLDARHPVILMLQAWASPRPVSYRDHWTDGHWVIAIGYTREGVVFADPYLDRARGYLSFTELDERWHDLEGPRNRRVERYGLAISGARATRRSTVRTVIAIE
jgi:predicted double-glycine peptidase